MEITQQFFLSCRKCYSLVDIYSIIKKFLTICNHPLHRKCLLIEVSWTIEFWKPNPIPSPFLKIIKRKLLKRALNIILVILLSKICKISRIFLEIFFFVRFCVFFGSVVPIQSYLKVQKYHIWLRFRNKSYAIYFQYFSINCTSTSI